MKYTILGFQQKKLLDLGLKTDDALLLRVIKDMYSSASMEFIVENNRQYMWVNQSYLLKQIPIIGSRRKLLGMLDKYKEIGLIEKILKHEKNNLRGSFSYIRPTVKLDDLQDYEPYAEITQGYAKSAQGVCSNNIGGVQNLPNKDTSIRDTSIKDTSIKDTSTLSSGSGNQLTKDMKDKILEEWNKLNLQNLRSINENTNRYKMLKARIEEYSYKEVLEAIGRINKSSFLKGHNKRNWTITFDWLIRPNNFIKVLEGNYDDKGGLENESNQYSYGARETFQKNVSPTKRRSISPYDY